MFLFQEKKLGHEHSKLNINKDERKSTTFSNSTESITLTTTLKYSHRKNQQNKEYLLASLKRLEVK